MGSLLKLLKRFLIVIIMTGILKRTKVIIYFLFLDIFMNVSFFYFNNVKSILIRLLLSDGHLIIIFYFILRKFILFFLIFNNF